MNAEQHEWYWRGYNDAKKREKREFVGLTDEDEIDWEDGDSLRDLVKAIEAKLKEKNAS